MILTMYELMFIQSNLVKKEKTRLIHNRKKNYLESVRAIIIP
jgi:hypothetical protein